MKLVGARFGGQIDVRSGSGAKLRRRDVGLNLELVDGIDRRLDRVELEEVFIVVHAVQSVVVRVAAIAGH